MHGYVVNPLKPESNTPALISSLLLTCISCSQGFSIPTWFVLSINLIDLIVELQQKLPLWYNNVNWMIMLQAIELALLLSPLNNEKRDIRKD